MVLKTGLGAKPFLPPVPCLTRFLAGIDCFWGFPGPDWFPIESVGPANLVWFLKP